MEIKKSETADLESRRPQRLLLGLVVSLACVFVALEYSVEPDDPFDDPELLARLDNEMELPPLLQPENELMLAPKAEPKPETKIVVVEEDETDQLTDDEPVETDADSDLEVTDEDELVEMEPPPPPDEDVVSLRVLEDAPQFPGGPVEFMKWLTRNLKYPKSLEEQKVQGKVVAEFIVNKDGSVTNVKVVSSLEPLCDQEVLRVLRMMPRWTAGVLNGEPCRTKVCIPVVFRI
ncbi:MAG: energy transducer TonB [Prevotella sp.]|nr:energy transducer TonB [Prevotella sp.]